MHTNKIRYIFILSWLLFLLNGCGSGNAILDEELTREQQNIHDQLFQNIDNTLDHVDEIQADLYSPENYEKGKQHYDKASRLLRNDKNIDDIRDEIRKAAEAFEKAEETTNIGVVTFREAIEIRDNALDADAPEYSPELWEEAEASFREAAIRLEGGRVNRARQQAQESKILYDDAELEAIKASFLNPARDLLKTAADEKADNNAPKTIAKAKVLVVSVEEDLEADRYETTKANQLAQEAAYEASLGLYLHRSIVDMKDEGDSYEDVFLSAQQPIRAIGEAMNVEVTFDNGFEASAKLITNELLGQGFNKASLADSLQQYQTEVSILRAQLEEKSEMAEQIEGQRQREDAINKVINLFDPSQGNVFLDGSSVLIRLYGLSFPVGSSIIEPPNFSLLSKVQEAIRQYPNATISIEGHTDSQGGAQLNKRLSEERASAVAQYIRANIGESIRMSASGYGPDRPVASNETVDGRAKNRRIDVVINPG
ncbi:MAG: OmpA family protein, partial [Balneolales bacterium]